MATGNYDPTAMARFYASQDLQTAAGRALRAAQSPRQVQLNYYKAFFDAEQYEPRTVSWSGRKVLRLDERDGVMRGNVPPGYFNSAMVNDQVPLEHRKPDVQHHKVRQIVRKGTSALFSERTRPSVRVKNSEAATAWLVDLTKSCSLWYHFLVARNRAGAVGSAALTAKFVSGKLMIEVHEAELCTPTIIDHATGDCSALEIRYLTPGLVMDPATGKQRDGWLWYRRRIDTIADTTFKLAPLDLNDPGKEPVWEVEQTFTHNLGFFLGVWMKNGEAPGRIDGDPDCKGIYDNVEMMDRLLTQAATGAVTNADPTFHVSTDDATLGQISKGSRHAIKTEKGGMVGYAEMTGSGAKIAMEVFDKIDAISGDAVGFVRDQEREGGTVTAEEIRRRQGAEFAITEERREHLTQTAIVPFIERIVRAVRELSKRTVTDPATGLVMQTVVSVPMPSIVDEGEIDSRQLQHADMTIEIDWPPLAPQTTADAQGAATAAAQAKLAGVISRATAVAFIATPFNIENPDAEVKLIEAEEAIRARALESDMLSGMEPAPAPAPTPVVDPEPTPEPVPEVDDDLDAIPEGQLLAPGVALDVTGDAAAVSGKEQDLALNGAQIASIIEMAEKVYGGTLPREAALAIAEMSFPWVDRALLDRAIPLINPAEVVPIVAPDPMVAPAVDPALSPTATAVPQGEP